MEDYLIPDPQDFDLEAAKLARKRRIAQQLIATQAPDTLVGRGGIQAMSGPMGGIAAALSRAAGHIDMNRLDQQERLLGQQEVGRNRALLQRAGVDPDLATANPTIRNLLEAQMQKVERGSQQAADRQARAAEAEAARIEKGEQLAADRVARKELRDTPTIHITNSGGGRSGQGKAPSGYRWNEDGTALEAIPGGPKDASNAKPTKLTASQQKAYDDSDVLLGHIDNALEFIKANPNAVGYKTVIPDIALSKIDPEGVQTRAAVAGLSAERVHQLSGAAVSPAEFARLRPYLPASGDTAEAAAKKLTSLRGEVERIKAAHARGPTMSNPNAKAPVASATGERKTIGGKNYVKRNGEWYAE
jgi:hypothetical protein